MKIIVTGGAGFIGSNLVRLLVENKQCEVVNLDKLTYAGNINSLIDVEERPNYCFEQVDLCDAESIRRVFLKHNPDAVMHLAAESHVDRSIDGPGEFIQTNILGTFHLLQAALGYYKELEGDKRDRFRFLHVSTDEVYGDLSMDDEAFSETTAYDPHSPYSASKAASDHLARAWKDTYGLPVMVTNCSNNYGPFQFPEKLIPVVLLNALAGKDIPVYGKGENVRDWLYVEDHAEALYTVLIKGVVGETYNIGGNNELKNIDIVHKLCSILDEIVPREDGQSYSEQIQFVSDRPGHDMRYAINAAKIKNEVNWVPKENAESGFRKTVNWYLENEAWWSDVLNGSYQLERLGVLSKEVS